MRVRLNGLRLAGGSICLLSFLGALAIGLGNQAGAAPPTTTLPCERAETKAALRSFVVAFNGSDSAKLDALFAQEPDFQWYSTPNPGRRLGAAAKQRDTLVPYLRRRHANGDRFRLASFQWNGKSAHWSNFGFRMLRNEPDEEGWFPTEGKGATICDEGKARFIVLTFGSRIPG